MALSCGAKCAKLLLIVFNAVFWVSLVRNCPMHSLIFNYFKASGIVLFTLGIFFLVEDERSSLFKLFVVEKYNYALLQILAWAFIVIGAAIGLIGFCGCCGAIKENRWVLIVVSIKSLFPFLTLYKSRVNVETISP